MHILKSRGDGEATHNATRARILRPKTALIDEVGAVRETFIDGVRGAFVVFDDGLVASRGGADPTDGVEIDIFSRDGGGGGGVDDPRIACKIVCDG